MNSTQVYLHIRLHTIYPPLGNTLVYQEGTIGTETCIEDLGINYYREHENWYR